MLREAQITCPYCGEIISILLDDGGDDSGGEQAYIEDCQVCCQPIEIRMHISATGECRVEARHQDEV